jgi:hypothetical protein
VSTAEKPSANLNTMSDYFALAMFTNRRNCLNCTLEAVERMPGFSRYQFESLVIFVAAYFTFRHLSPQLFTSALKPKRPSSISLFRFCFLRKLNLLGHERGNRICLKHGKMMGQLEEKK